uniref:ORF34 n=1 Tax=Latid herpesvirus 1 TaxID=3096545 RepID=A0AB33V978_9VIRU
MTHSSGPPRPRSSAGTCSPPSSTAGASTWSRSSTALLGERFSGGLEERVLGWSRHHLYGSDTADGWAPPALSFLTSNVVIRIRDSDPPFYVHSKHVNTVHNKQHVVHTRRRAPYKLLQSSIVKADTPRFVMDKKKLVNLFGIKNTRIEFTEGEQRSANYTSNCKPLIQPPFRGYFDLVMKAHEEFSVGGSRGEVINNLNYTTYLYGVCNPFSTVVQMTEERKQRGKQRFLEPLFFSSINLINYDINTNQFFTSMTINSQRLAPGGVNDLGKNLYPIYSLLELDLKLNWFCCTMGLFLEGFLNTPNKVVILWYNELYYLNHPAMNERGTGDWIPYRNFMLRHCASCINGFSMAFGQRLNQFIQKNCEFIHLVSALLDEPEEPYLAAIQSYGDFLVTTGKYRSFTELLCMLGQCLGPEAIHKRSATETAVRHGRGELRWCHGECFRVGKEVTDILSEKIGSYLNQLDGPEEVGGE